MKGNLTRKQVSAMSRALKRRGRKLPKVGYCAIFRRPDGSKTVEVCRDRHGYYAVGKLDRMDRYERRRAKRSR